MPPATLQYPRFRLRWSTNGKYWPFLQSFKNTSFAFTLQAFYELGLQIFKLSEEQVLAHTLNYFVEPANPAITKYQQLINEENEIYPTATVIHITTSYSWWLLI